MRTVTALCAAIGFLIAAPSALAATGPQTETVSSGAVTATLTYTMKSDYEAAAVRLAITRAGVPATLEGGANPAAGCEECDNAIPVGALALDGPAATWLAVTALDGNGELEVI